ncbi:hypothetical protein TW95_gp1209 [Pandoravirus inopinatum]|uniref:Uncharacterized protein n=1 Tax=Pandoravirus inopinatum TaxID=1605721 RepID=A0A0B5IYI2_9VIRU|nr:hypothetical protein TW95_gp1209 [Pandoravirus inopinatum]AJF97943.1 hypothetical protein [Pandoravirus inopinatum]
MLRMWSVLSEADFMPCSKLTFRGGTNRARRSHRSSRTSDDSESKDNWFHVRAPSEARAFTMAQCEKWHANRQKKEWGSRRATTAAKSAVGATTQKKKKEKRIQCGGRPLAHGHVAWVAVWRRPDSVAD